MKAEGGVQTEPCSFSNFGARRGWMVKARPRATDLITNYMSYSLHSPLYIVIVLQAGLPRNRGSFPQQMKMFSAF
jgi:hypothetical protein